MLKAHFKGYYAFLQGKNAEKRQENAFCRVSSRMAGQNKEDLVPVAIQQRLPQVISGVRLAHVTQYSQMHLPSFPIACSQIWEHLVYCSISLPIPQRNLEVQGQSSSMHK